MPALAREAVPGVEAFLQLAVPHDQPPAADAECRWRRYRTVMPVMKLERVTSGSSVSSA